MSEELKPCPFCGSMPRFWHWNDSAIVECWCTDHRVQCEAKTLDEAKEAWNRRAGNDLPAAEPREWTPIKEGPPKEFGQYLVTITPAAGELWSKVEIAHYSDLMGIAKPGFWTGNVGKSDFEDLTELVTAWAPCPQPYKKEENEK